MDLKGISTFFFSFLLWPNYYNSVLKSFPLPAPPESKLKGLISNPLPALSPAAPQSLSESFLCSQVHFYSPTSPPSLYGGFEVTSSLNFSCGVKHFSPPPPPPPGSLLWGQTHFSAPSHPWVSTVEFHFPVPEVSPVRLNSLHSPQSLSSGGSSHFPVPTHRNICPVGSNSLPRPLSLCYSQCHFPAPWMGCRILKCFLLPHHLPPTVSARGLKLFSCPFPRPLSPCYRTIGDICSGSEHAVCIHGWG